MDTETLVAVGTLILAAVTGFLALSTRRMAATAVEDQRAEWRPVLIAAEQEVDESVDGELGIRVRNVGRGPALGIHGQLRIEGPAGATPPGAPDVVLPNEVLDLRFSAKTDFSRGYVVRLEVWYYDIGERWHATEFTATVREQQDGSKPLRIARSIVSKPGRRVGATDDSHAAKVVEVQRTGAWRRAWSWLRRRP